MASAHRWTFDDFPPLIKYTLRETLPDPAGLNAHSWPAFPSVRHAFNDGEDLLFACTVKPTSFLKSPFLTLINKVSEYGRYEKHRVDWKSSSSKVASGLPFPHVINRLISDQALSADEVKVQVIPRLNTSTARVPHNWFYSIWRPSICGNARRATQTTSKRCIRGGKIAMVAIFPTRRLCRFVTTPSREDESPTFFIDELVAGLVPWVVQKFLL